MNSEEFNDLNDFYKVIFVLGPPGSGKNTQCAKIVSKYSLIHFGCGDLLRAAAEEKSEEGEYINQLIKDGKIVPVRITCSLAKREMEKHGKKNVFLIDGFPRNLENLEGWLQEFKEACKILAVLFLDCPEDTCIDRIGIRSQTSGRVDDNVESLKKRFVTFRNETIPNLENLSKVTRVISIESNRDREEIFREVCLEFDKILNFEN